MPHADTASTSSARGIARGGPRGLTRNSYRGCQPAIDVEARVSRKSSIFLQRIVGVMFMRVNSKYAHQVRPPSGSIRRSPPLGKTLGTIASDLYSSRSVLAGSIRATLRIGGVARSVTAQSVSTTASMVGASYTPTP